MNTTPSPSVSGPPQPSQHQPPSYLIVLFSGLFTTVLTLIGIYWMNTHVPDFNVMGWYVEFIIPAGAILVGMVAALGYGVASWISGIKIVRSLFWAVLFFQVSAYFGAEYMEFKKLDLVYKDTNESVGFFKYFDMNTRSFEWKGQNDTAATPLGVWGYAFRGLEIIGFACGGLIVPLALSRKAYCDDCRRYMKHRSLALLPASVPPKKFKKSDTAGEAAHQEEQQKAFASVQELLGMLRQMATEGRTDDFQKAIGALKTRKKETAKLPIRYRMDMDFCEGCATGWLRIWQIVGQGKHLQQKEQPRIDVPREFVAAMQAKK